MKIAIFYFSGTGNSLSVARDLAEALGNARLIPIAKAVKDDSLQEYESIGIVYPVYMFGLPLIVKDFLEKVNIDPKAYVFSVATLGGMTGTCHTMIERVLKKRGLKLCSGFSIIMPGNYTPLYGAISGEKQREMFNKEKVRIKEIAARINKRERGTREERPFLLNLLLTKLLYNAGSSQIPSADKGFWITDACAKCGLCAKVCPAANIELVKGIPNWLGHCQHCMACLQWCPCEAIQYKKSTLGKKRYRHPGVSPEDIAAQR